MKLPEILLITLLAGNLSAVEFKKENANTLDAYFNNKVAGRLTFKDCTIKSLVVLTPMRNQGIGVRLFKQALNEMKDCNCVSWDSYLNSFNFYLKQGGQFTFNKSMSEKEKDDYIQNLKHLHQLNPKAQFPTVPMYINKDQIK